MEAALPGPGAGGGDSDPLVVADFLKELSASMELPVAVAAIRALVAVIQRSGANTMMGLEKELLVTSGELQRFQSTSIALRAACELFMCYVTRTSALDSQNFEGVKAHLIDRGMKFAHTALVARTKIAQQGGRFLRDGHVVLIHGYSRVVINLLQRAAGQGKRFRVLVTEAAPGKPGLQCLAALEKYDIECQLCMDSSVARLMEGVDLVLVGAEAIVESGGIINKVGTYQVALVAHALGKPCYVAAESYKFARLYPVNQRDLPEETEEVKFGDLRITTPSRDYTPPELLGLLFTDLGVLTPAAVSDELIKLYN